MELYLNSKDAIMLMGMVLWLVGYKYKYVTFESVGFSLMLVSLLI